MSHYDLYGRMAEADFAEIIQNGRYLAQKEAEKLIPADVIRKLELNQNDQFLDVGCGLGLNLEHISKVVKYSVGCDHPNVIDKLKKIHPNIKADLFGGNFLDIKFSQKYSKILIYSVLPSLPDQNTVYAFVEKVLSLLDSEGTALLGDLANIDKKKRFLASNQGKEFQKKWKASNALHESQDQKKLLDFQENEDTEAVIIDDVFIFGLVNFIRKKGFNAYIVEQPHDLPFGHTREDIVIKS